MRRIGLFLLVAVVSVLPAGAQQTGTTITIINMDDPGEGFNDETPKDPVGGNAGTTLGEQRLIAFQFAADLWAALLDSAVEIRVEANFDPLECGATSAVLGAAGPTTVFSDFPNAPIPNTWYVGALASKLAGEDLNGGDAVIQARFNSALNGDPNCAGGSSWYYGLDNNPGANQTDLVVVVLHELAHGLGFLTTTDKENGQFLSGRADIYSRFLYDNSLDRFWPQMSATERSISATNTNNLVWNGENVNAAAPSFLGSLPILEVLSPESVEGRYDIGLATFGAEITVAGVTAVVAAAEDDANSSGPSQTDGCTSLTNSSDIAGRIALIDRGDCTFVTKAVNAQAAGAVGVVIVNNQSGPAPGMSGSDSSITIPVVSVSMSDGADIRAVLDEGVEASIRLDASRLAGTDPDGRVKMYAPNPVEGGSSISHWDTSTEPDLLMEPSINASLGHGVDLSRDLFSDLGWFSDASVEATLRDILTEDIDFDGAFDPGDTIRLVSAIQNNGFVAGQNVAFELAMPTGLEVVPGTVSGGTVIDDTSRVAVEIGSLPVGGEKTVTFDARVAPDLSPTIDSFALQGEVTGSNLGAALTDDPSTPEPDDPTVIEISRTPLRAFKRVELFNDVDDNGVLSGGDVLMYRVLIQNNGSASVSSVVFDDVLDELLDEAGSVSATGGGVVVSGNEPGDRSIRVTFAEIPASSFVNITFLTNVVSDLPQNATQISNQGTVTASGVESLLTDDLETPTLFDPTIIRFPQSRERAVRRP